MPALLDASLFGSVSKRMGAARLMLATPHPGLAFLETLAHVRDDTRRRARWAEVGGSVVYANPGCWLPAHEQATGCPRLVWCARQGDRYGRIRVLEYRGEAGCRAPFRS